MRRFFNRIADKLDEFFAWNRHDRRMFWTAFVIELAALFSHSYVFGSMIALASGSVGALLHCVCDRKEVRILWVRTDVPDIKTVTNALKNGETDGKCFERSTLRHTVYGIALAAIIYAAYIAAGLWM